MSTLPKVLIAAPVHSILPDALAGLGYESLLAEQITQQTAYALIAECEGVITSTRLQLDRKLLDAAPKLRWIGRMGSGMEVIDLGYARERGVACFASPEGNCNAVGEHALGMLLDLARRITWSRNEMAAGIWKREENRGYELEGRTVGIIGFGHAGAAFARKLSGFDVRIMAYDKYHTDGIAPGIIKCETLDELMAEAEIVSFHVPLQSDTLHYLDASFVANMARPFILVNTSRGPVVQMKALYDGLVSGKIKGACLDVFEEEPLAVFSKDNASIFEKMTSTPNVVFTPHIAGYTFEALYKMSKTLVDKLSLYLEGRD